MPKIAILSDIHGNLPAFEAVLARVAKTGSQEIAFGGDLVGYGADPRPVLERVREIDPQIVAGNHDWGVAGRLSLNYFNQQARAAIHWTRSVLDRTDVAWLGSLRSST